MPMPCTHAEYRINVYQALALFSIERRGLAADMVRMVESTIADGYAMEIAEGDVVQALRHKINGDAPTFEIRRGVAALTPEATMEVFSLAPKTWDSLTVGERTRLAEGAAQLAERERQVRGATPQWDTPIATVGEAAREPFAPRAAADSDLACAARSLMWEVDKARGKKIDGGTVLDPLHPICIMAEHVKTELGKLPATTDLFQAVDAARWRALMKSARMRRLGWAGFKTESPGHAEGYRHLGIDLWTMHGETGHKQTDDNAGAETAKTQELLVDYVRAMMKVLDDGAAR